MKSIFEQYYEVRHQLDALSEMEAKLKEEVLAELEKLPASTFDKSTYKSPFGNFTKKITKKYSFSTAIAEKSVEIEKAIKEYSEPILKEIEAYSKPLRDRLETLKQDEIDRGIAKETVSVGVSFSYLKK